MFKSIIVAAMVMLAGVVAAAPANAGPYCDALGDNPSINKAETVMRQAILYAIQSGTDVDTFAADVATDIIDNCPQNESIVLQALDNLDGRGA